jgi:transposase
VKNTEKVKANAMGFYAVNGGPPPPRSRSEDVCACFESVRAANGSHPVIMILDNFSSNHSMKAAECAERFDTRLVFLPPYCPHLNPIEFIWKLMKRAVSKTWIMSRDHMVSLLSYAFEEETANDSYFGYWTKMIHSELIPIFR